jgi:phosphatidylethanolamine-binding protein (PEBP) family uncharacterized protein
MTTTTLSTWQILGTALLALSCSETDPRQSPLFDGGGSAGDNAGGASGSGAGGAAGNAAGGSGNAGGASTTAGSGTGVGGSETAGNGGETSGGAGGSSGGAQGGGGAGGASAGDFELTSPAFEHVEACTTNNREPCNFFPEINTFTNIGGMNQSPELNWGAGPDGTLSYVVCLHDTSVGANGATHWCLWNIPGATRQLPANLGREKMPDVPAGSSQDNLFNTDEGYVGPGARGNVYQFRLYALSVASYSPPDAEDRRTVYSELEADADGTVLATSTLRGRANPQ